MPCPPRPRPSTPRGEGGVGGGGEGGGSGFQPPPIYRPILFNPRAVLYLDRMRDLFEGESEEARLERIRGTFLMYTSDDVSGITRPRYFGVKTFITVYGRPLGPIFDFNSAPFEDRLFSDWLDRLVPHDGIELNGMSKVLKKLSREAVIDEISPHRSFADMDSVFTLCDETLPKNVVDSLCAYVEQGGVWYAHCRSDAYSDIVLPHYLDTLLSNGATNFRVKKIGSETLPENDYYDLAAKGAKAKIGLLTPNSHDYIAHFSDGESPLYASFEYGKGRVYFGISDIPRSKRKDVFS